MAIRNTIEEAQIVWHFTPVFRKQQPIVHPTITKLEIPSQAWHILYLNANCPECVISILGEAIQ
jgi:hypothetical protein